MHTHFNIHFVGALLFGIGCSPPATKTTIDVGPGQSHATLSQVVDDLVPGDVVRIHGGATYEEGVELRASGSDAEKITIRGVPVDGRLPVLSGTLMVLGDHLVLEQLEIRDGNPACVLHGGHDLTLRDSVVHDCPSHGILGADVGSGSLTLERVEVYDCAYEQSGNAKHQIYIATDEVAHPGAVFRMQSCHVHDAGPGGSNIKSRAERTEIYSNLIEDAGLYEIELYGPDEDAVPEGWSKDLAREDADVVGNVFQRTHAEGPSFLFRIGGDGDGSLGDAGPNASAGRVRFAYNTVIAPGGKGVFLTFNDLESVEAHNNVFYSQSGGLRILEDDAYWTGGSQLVTGAHNWLSEGASQVPEGWTATLIGDDPQLSDLAAGDLSPGEGSALVDAGASPTTSPAGNEFPDPLQVPIFHPPMASGEITLRTAVGPMDIGAFEQGGATTPPVDPVDEPATESASCQLARAAGRAHAGWLLLASALLFRRRSRTSAPAARRVG
jgi:hypothetical protein